MEDSKGGVLTRQIVFSDRSDLGRKACLLGIT